jgi:aspartokinase
LERPLVIKFGGSSVGGGAQFVRAARIAADAAADNPVAVVVSAMSGTTDTLLGYARMSSTWVKRTVEDETHRASIADLRRMLAERHLHAAREAVAAEQLPEVEGRVVDLLGELEEVIGAPSDNVKARRDEIAVYGERLSAEILAGVPPPTP